MFNKFVAAVICAGFRVSAYAVVYKLLDLMVMKKAGCIYLYAARLAKWIGKFCSLFCKVSVGLFVIINSITSSQATTPAGTAIDNVATANFDVGGPVLNTVSNTATVITTRTPSTIQLLQYTPGVSTVNEDTPSSCRNGSSGPFVVSPNPVISLPGSGATTLDPGNPIELSPSVLYRSGDPIFVLVDDPDQNLDTALADTIVVRVSSTIGDEEDLLLTETDLNTGIFIAYIQSSSSPLAQFDCQLTVSLDSSVTASYIDVSDGSDSTAISTLVDPFGILFDSANGSAIDNVTITLIDSNTGAPAIPGVQIFGEDGVSAYPNTLVTGSSATDSGGTVVVFPSGGYKFPLLLPGNYRLQITVSPGFLAPSQASIANLQNLPGSPFALHVDASFGNNFVLNPGPPLHVDIPMDPITVQLVVDKTASSQHAGIGDFIEYKVNVENVDAAASARSVFITDVLPQGFRYQAGSAKFNTSPMNDPIIAGDGRTLQFNTGSDLNPSGILEISYVAEVTSGTPLGNSVNRVSASDNLGASSNLAVAAVDIRDEFMQQHATIVGRVLVGNCPVQPQDDGEASIRLRSRYKNNTFKYTVDFSVESIAVSNYALIITLPADTSYMQGSSRLDGLVISDPIATQNQLTFQFGNEDAFWPADWSHHLRFQARLNKDEADYVQLVTHAVGRMDTLSKQNQKTSTVDNVISMESPDTRLVSLDNSVDKEAIAVQEKLDSGTFKKVIIGTPWQQDPPSIGTELQGLHNVRIYMDNGTYTLTDEEGKYHIEGVTPGTRVVQLDTTSLPPNLEIISCEENTRFAGKAYSRFVDVKGGTLWRADFHVKEKPPITTDVVLDLRSQLRDRDVNVEILQHGKKIPLENYRLTVVLPEGLSYKLLSSLVDGEPMSDPDVNGNILVYRLGDFPGDWQRRVRFKANLSDDAIGELKIKATAMFNTAIEKNVRIPVAENIVRKKEDRFSDRQFVFQPKFESLKTELNFDDKAELDQFLASLDIIEIEDIKVVGHTDNLPIRKAKQYLFKDNYALSKARAVAVASYLKDGLQLDDERVVSVGMGPDEPVASNKTNIGRAKNRRTEVYINTVQRTALGEVSVVRNGKSKQTVSISGRPEVSIEKPVVELPEMEKLNVEDFGKLWLNLQQPGTEWLMPAKDFIPSMPSINVAIKHNPKHSIDAEIKGEKLNPLFYFGIETNEDKTIARSYWQGIHLVEGPNQLAFKVRDEQGKIVRDFQRTVHYSGQPVRAEIVSEYSHLIADGISIPTVAVRFYDRWDKPVRPGVIGQFTVIEPYFSKEFIDATKQNPLIGLSREYPQYYINDHGIALIELEPTIHSGNAKLIFVFNKENEQELNVWLKPKSRDWIVVGVADATIGNLNIAGNSQSAFNFDFEDNSYNERKISLFAKGSINDEWLLTAAFDSSKDEEKVGNSLFQTIDPDRFFTLYGDDTQQYYEAASAKKLFAKIENQKFYAMFGDYDTGLNETELSKFNRNLTGVKSVFQGELFSFNTFAAETSQRFVKDEIQGNGTSGLYRLSQSNIIINSEEIIIETRDRFHSHDIIDSRRLRRHFDYDINYQTGTLFFKQPIASRDTNFNPIFIIVDYETDTPLDGDITGGGRAAVNLLDDKLNIGLSLIHDDSFQSQGDLFGTDVTYRINNNSEVKIEFSSSDVDDAGLNRKGSAYLTEYKHFSETLESRIYLREQEDGFGLGQQAGGQAATRKFGLDGSYRLSQKFRLNAELYHEDNLATNAQRDVSQVGVGYASQKMMFNVGYRSAVDEDSGGNTNESSLLLLGASTKFLDNKFAVRLNNEISLGSSDDNPDYPSRYIAGLDYFWKPNINLYAEHEITEGDAQDSNSTRIGLRASPWTMTQFNTSVEQQISEYGPRVFASLGLTQGFKLSDQWSADVSLDRVDTMRHPGAIPFNLNVPLASGTVNNDFTALSTGAHYTGEKSSFVGRFENRDAETENTQGAYFGWYRDQREGIGYSIKAQLFDTELASGEIIDTTSIRMSFSYRPSDSKWIHLNRLDVKSDDKVDFVGINNRSKKIINNWRGNYMINRNNQIAFSHGLKYTLDNFAGDEYSGLTQLLGVEYRRDLSKRWDIGVRASVLDSFQSDNRKYSFGIDTGWTIADNMWLSTGYNIDGFDDPDFSLAGYTAKGFFVKLRVKFDQHTFHDIFNRQDRNRK